MNVQAVREQQHRTLLHVRCQHVVVQLLLHHVRGQHGNQVGVLHCIGRRLDGEAIGLRLDLGRAARTQAYHHIEAGFAQVQCVGAATAAVADDGDLGLGQVVGAHGEVPCGGKKRTAGRRGDVPAGQGKAVEEALRIAQAQPPRGVVVVWGRALH